MPDEEITWEDIHKELVIASKLRLVRIIQQQLLSEQYDMKNEKDYSEYTELRLISRRIIMDAADHYGIELPK